MEPHSKLSPPTLTRKLNEGLSFELRTLLNGFSGPIQLLKHRVDDPELFDVFRLIDTSLSRLERLAVRSSTIINFDNQQQSFSTSSQNIVDIAKFGILELQSISDLENVKITIANQPHPILITGNSDLLLQLFEILLEIAISLSKENSTIDIRFETDPVTCCTIQSHTAVFPKAMNLAMDECFSSNEINWDFVLAKKIALFHNAQINVIEDHGIYNAFIIKFTTDKA